MPFFDSDGVSIYYEVHGAGRPIVLVHGFASSFARNWAGPGWVTFLTANGFQVIGLDVRGHGQSARLYRTEEYRTPLLAADVLHLLDHLGIDTADLMGFSMGGGIALHLAMFHGERFRSVVAGGVADAHLPGGHDPAQLAQIAEALSTDQPETIARPLGKMFRDFAERGGNDLAALAAAMGGSGWPGHLERTAPIDRPLLIVIAEKDEIVAGTEKLARALPKARLVVIPGTKHNTVIGDKRFKETVLGFLLEDM